jgi:hypothetical protein
MDEVSDHMEGGLDHSRVEKAFNRPERVPIVEFTEPPAGNYERVRSAQKG